MLPRNCTANNPGEVIEFVANRSIEGPLQEVCEGVALHFGEGTPISASVRRPPIELGHLGEKMTHLDLRVESNFAALESLQRLAAFQDGVLYPLYDRDANTCDALSIALADVPDELEEHFSEERVKKFEAENGRSPEDTARWLRGEDWPERNAD